MPRYDIRPDRPDDALPFPHTGGHLLDATGAAVPFPVAYDPDSGEVERYDRDSGGFRIDPRTRRVALIREVRPAPLKYVVPADEPFIVGG